MPDQKTYTFEPFVLEPSERRLRRQQELIPVPPKIFDTLVVLVENRGRLVEKAELMSRLWPDATVEEVNLARNISDLRKILADGSEGQAYIETAPKKGYRFIAQVHEAVPDKAEPATARGRFPFWWLVPAAALVAMMAVVLWRVAMPGSPGSLAVLPFRALDAA